MMMLFHANSEPLEKRSEENNNEPSSKIDVKESEQIVGKKRKRSPYNDDDEKVNVVQCFSVK
jgi:hypothetical protein